jgi:hypothetical protein
MVFTEASPAESAREEERDRRLRHRICFLLDLGSWSLFALFVVHLLPVLVESKPMQPEWQGQVVEVIERQAILAFLGFVLLHLAVLLNPKKQSLRKRLRQIRHLAVIASIGFLLLIPMQLSSSLIAFRAGQIRESDTAAQVTRLMQIRDSILRAKTTQELDLGLNAFSEPGLSPTQKTKNFVDVQRELVQDTDNRQAILTQSIKEDTSRYSPLILMLSRLAALVAWSAAFGAGAVPWGSKKTVLERVVRRRSDHP